MEYTEFTKEQQEATLKSRIAAWEADHFGHEINKQAFLSLPAGNDRDQGVKQSNEAQATLEASINSAKAHLTKLKSTTTTTTAPTTTTTPRV